MTKTKHLFLYILLILYTIASKATIEKSSQCYELFNNLYIESYQAEDFQQLKNYFGNYPKTLYEAVTRKHNKRPEENARMLALLKSYQPKVEKGKAFLSQTESEEVFNEIRKLTMEDGICGIPQKKYKNGICFARAIATQIAAARKGICANCMLKLWYIANDLNSGVVLPTQNNNDIISKKQLSIYHTATAIRTLRADDTIEFLVIDPLLAEHPITVTEWYQRLIELPNMASDTKSTIEWQLLTTAVDRFTPIAENLPKRRELEITDKYSGYIFRDLCRYFRPNYCPQ